MSRIGGISVIAVANILHNENLKNNSIKKFNNLKQKYNTCSHPFSNINNSKWLVNISSKDIPDTVSDFLSLGENFALPIEQKQNNDRTNYVLDVIKNFEVNSNILPTDTIETTRISVANILQRFLTTKKHISSSDHYILNSFALSKKYLRENYSDIMVTRADKGQTTVVMNKKDYSDKMYQLLNDPTTYKPLNKDPLKKLTNKINELVKSWRKNNLINSWSFARSIKNTIIDEDNIILWM
ncbi:uncharacterized protein LOC112637689 [Camponotus floridanus]|uniref:uncharacterized protein LOC112637689 n=1 Tax=Camponotus floridanus TaxID=104421 RepID=UPI000DC67067|nr:uncharacterized protein LOC112637689 [Camponotus floridanus]